MDLNRENMKKLMFLITFAVLLFVGVQRLDVVLGAIGFLWGILFPFVLGGAIAFILNVPMAAIEKRLFSEKDKPGHKVQQKLARPVSLVLAVAFVLAVVALVVFVVVPELGATFSRLGGSIEAFFPQAQAWLETYFRDNEQVAAFIGDLKVDWSQMLENALNLFKNGAGNMLSSTVNVAKGIVGAFATFFIGLVFSFYLLLQKEKLGEQVKKLLRALLKEKQVARILYVCTLSQRTFSGFITGQCIEALILGLLFFVVMSIVRLPYALMISVLIGFTALIPVFGAFIGCGVGAFLILVENPVQALIFVILFLVLQQLEGNLIYPHVVGGSVGLPSIWVLAAVSIGGSLMGVMGMLIFIPLVSVCYTLLREWVYKRLKQEGK